MSRSHCRLCDRPIHYVARRFVWVHDTRGADHGPIPGPVVQPAPATLSEVWCERCPDPATTEVRITDGTTEWTSARCALHAGALINAARVTG